MNPEFGIKHFSNHILMNLKLLLVNKSIKCFHAVKIPIFKEFGIETFIEFLILPWHKKYDCLLSFKDLATLQYTIDLKNKLLKISNFNIQGVP